ncbi:hypothetical protein J1605_019290 [Eschrichtius robustus]|uniref:Uncharacterized protein n=1 Tax=Eschrichtius robustus TaxID=9764 RepID=A0AB34HP49_ESCRO|nr:hypothetical protein J1605_019290 [Eschrichtius robustus]
MAKLKGVYSFYAQEVPCNSDSSCFFTPSDLGLGLDPHHRLSWTSSLQRDFSASKIEPLENESLKSSTVIYEETQRHNL